MKKLLVLSLLAIPAWSQLVYTASKTTVLSGTAEVITVQQPATGSKIVRFISAFIDSTAACAITIEKDGTAATGTALTPAPVLTGQVASAATAFYSSDVGSGTVITRASIPADGSIVVDLSRISMVGNNKGMNLTVRTASCTGTVDIVITYSTQNN